ncbi:DUF1674 domain-containing protein [Mesorhizobium sp. IMUNJ 23232]|uniref:DUF1674 domain-containing protein n=1 Tax=Mesorhizobium sp. IMUNJ 23232 TaxID=3376064 RepID=UPI00378725F3
MISDEDAMAVPAGEAAANPPASNGPSQARPLTAAARRALDEAAARRAQTEARVAAMPREFGGRRGEEPVRYGDWEIKGIASDF